MDHARTSLKTRRFKARIILLLQLVAVTAASVLLASMMDTVQEMVDIGIRGIIMIVLVCCILPRNLLARACSSLTSVRSTALRLLRNPRGWTTVTRIQNECHLETATGTDIVEFEIELQRDRFGARRMRMPVETGLGPNGLRRLHGLAIAQRWVADGQPISC